MAVPSEYPSQEQTSVYGHNRGSRSRLISFRKAELATRGHRCDRVAVSALKMERLGRAMPDNPKTGVLTALTMADDLMKMVRASDW